MLKRITRLAEAWSFIPAALRELPPEQQTTFVLRPLAQAERLAANDAVARTITLEDGSRATVSRERQVAYGLCLTHVVSIENFPPGEPQPWPEKREQRIAYLETLDDDVIREVGDQIYTRSTVGVAEKNS